MTEFVGRRALLEAARRIAREAGTRAVLVAGEPGSGKSRLIQEIVRELGTPTVFWVQGHEPELVIPWAATGRMLAELASRDAALAAAVSDHSAAPLFVLEATHRALAGSAAPVALVVDDAQWLDAYSRALLHYLVRAADQDHRGLLLVAAGRPDRTTDELHDAVVGILSAQSVVRLEVGPLSRDEGVTLLRAVRPDIDEATAVAHWQLAAGSPFWLGLLAQSDGSSATVGVVRSRLRAVEADAGTLIGLLAVAARPMYADDVAAVLGWTPPRTRAAAESLVHANVATWTGGQLAVVHDLVREIVEADLLAEVRRGHHRRLAEWFAREDEPAGLLVAAQHAAAAGEDAVGLAERAATSPRRHRIGVDGLIQLVRICEATTQPGGGDLALCLAELATEMREPATAQVLWQRLAGEHPEAAVRQRAAHEAARSAYQLGDVAVARHWLSRAREGCTEGSVARIRLDVLDSHVKRWMEGRFAEATEAAARASAAAHDLHPGDFGRAGGHEDRADPALRAVLHEILESRSDGALMEGDYRAMDAVTQEMTQLAHGDADREYTAAAYRLDALLLLERAREAEGIARRYWQAATESGHPTQALEMGANLVAALLDQGRAGEAAAVVVEVEPLLARVVDLGGRVTTGGGLPIVSRTIHWANALTGDWRSAMAGLDAELAASGTHLGSTSLLLMSDLTAWLGTPGDDLAPAARLADRAVSAASEVRCSRCTEDARMTSARLRGLLGDRTAAAELVDACRSARRSDPEATVVRRLRWAEAALRAADGSPEEAADALAGLQEEYASAGLHLSSWFVGLDRATVLAPAKPTDAVAVLDDVASAADRMGASTLAASASQRMRRLGARPWRRGRASGDGLTERETAVMELLATGASNPEIAAALFLSRKTVERHVSHILAKLGVRNRAEVLATMIPKRPREGADQRQIEGPRR
jgi:DNA-binding CsgD family transcriptional regulator